MGTKKYPSENAYQQFLSSNNGMSNAYTAMTSTNYYFDVAPDALEGALDRFSGFFIEPLFNEDCTEREITAVDSEHKKNLQNDMWVSNILLYLIWHGLTHSAILSARKTLVQAWTRLPEIRNWKLRQSLVPTQRRRSRSKTTTHVMVGEGVLRQEDEVGRDW
jgi:hypothetical protein